MLVHRVPSLSMLMEAPPSSGPPFADLHSSEKVHSAYFAAAATSSAVAEGEALPAPSARSGHAMVYCKHHHAVFLVGGLGWGNNVKNDLWRFDLVHEQWARVQTSGPPFPPSFGVGHALMADDRRWFFYGGLGRRDEHLRTVRVLDLDTFTWSRPNQLSDQYLRQMWGHSVSSTTVRGKEVLVVLGGMQGEETNDIVYHIDGTTLNLLQAFDVKRSLEQEHRLLASALKMRRRHGAVTYRDVFILMVAGRNRDYFFNDMWCYNVLLDEWIPVTQLATPKMMAAYFDNPESSEAGRAIRSAYIRYTFESGTQLPLAGRLPSSYLGSICPRTGASVVLSGDYVYVTGGFYWCFQGSTNFNDMHVYDIKQHTWANVRIPFASEAAVAGSTHRNPEGQECGRAGGVHDAAVRLREAGEYGSDLPLPFTMAGFVTWPAASSVTPSMPSTKRGQGAGGVGTKWLLFGGRLGDHPSSAQFTVRIFEPQCRLTWVAAKWLNSAAPGTSLAGLTNQCVSMVQDFTTNQRPFSVTVPLRLPAHDVMELFTGPPPDDMELDDVVQYPDTPLSLGDDEEWTDVDDDDEGDDDADE